jgi:hypothetical protein
MNLEKITFKGTLREIEGLKRAMAELPEPTLLSRDNPDRKVEILVIPKDLTGSDVFVYPLYKNSPSLEVMLPSDASCIVAKRNSVGFEYKGYGYGIFFNPEPAGST